MPLKNLVLLLCLDQFVVIYYKMTAKDFEDQVLVLSDRVYSMVARMLESKEAAEDAVQEIMMKLWDRRSGMVDHPNLPGLVFLTARNHCLDQLKRKRPLTASSELHLSMAEHENGHDLVEWKELATIIEGIISELPARQSEVILMRDIDGLEFSEIAGATELKVEHVRVLLSRARKHVMKKLKQIYGYEQKAHG